jgi:putative hydrolase of the HAD superfamily
MRKPDPGIYSLAMDIAHASPQECIYFDDKPMLVRAAQTLGIKSFHHQSFLHTKNIIEDFKNNN